MIEFDAADPRSHVGHAKVAGLIDGIMVHKPPAIVSLAAEYDDVGRQRGRASTAHLDISVNNDAALSTRRARKCGARTGVEYKHGANRTIEITKSTRGILPHRHRRNVPRFELEGRVLESSGRFNDLVGHNRRDAA